MRAPTIAQAESSFQALPEVPNYPRERVKLVTQTNQDIIYKRSSREK